MKKYLIFILIIFPILLNANIILNKSEKKFIHQKKYLTVFVSTNKEPIEFIDSNKEFSGVDIDIIKNICSDINIKPIFVKDNKDREETDVFTTINIDKFNSSDYSTSLLYQIRTYIIFHNFKDSKKTIKNLYLTSNIRSQKLIKKTYPKSNIIVDGMFAEGFNKFISDKESALILDNFSFQELISLSSKNREYYYKKEIFNPINVKIYVRNKNVTLLNILQKEIFNLEFKNVIPSIINKWSNYELDKINIYKEKRMVIYLTFLNLFILIISLLLRLYYNKNIERFVKIVEEYKSREKKINSELLEKEKIIEKNETLHNDFLEKIYSIIIKYDLYGNIIYVNEMIEKLLHYKRSKIIGKNLFEVFPEEIAQKLISAFGMVDIRNEKYEELTFFTSENLTKNFEYKFIFTENNEGEIIINCLLKDVTDKKVLEKKLEAYNSQLESIIQQRTARLRQSEQRFKSVVESTSDGIIILDKNKFIFANKAFHTFTGYSKKEIFHGLMRFSHIIPKEVYQKIKEYLFDVSKLKNKEFKIESELINKQQTKILCEINLTHAFYLDKEVTLCVIRDVTAKKIAEEEKLAQQKLMTITQLSVTTNDRINSPLMTIAGYVEMLNLLVKDDPKIIEILKKIDESVNEINLIMNKLQSLNKIIYKNYKLENELMLDLDSVLEGKGVSKNEKNN